MKPEIFEMGPNGGLVQVDMESNNDLPNGQVILWGGNIAWSPQKFVICQKIPNDSFGTQYLMINLEDHSYHRTEAYGMKRYDDKNVWHSQHMFILDEQLSPAETKDLVAKAETKRLHDEEAQLQADDERQRLIQKGRELFAQYVPPEAQAVIVAEREVDDSNPMIDYFATHTGETVILGWSPHQRQLFSEMRKFAARIPETADLVHKSLFEPRVVVKENGNFSHWHRDVEQDADGNQVFFYTKEEADNYIMNHPLGGVTIDGVLVHFAWEIVERSFEHRESKGMYLKSGRSRGGWEISKAMKYKDQWSDSLCLAMSKRCVLGGE